MSSAPRAFHPIERSILNSLSNSDHVGAHSLAASTGLSIDQIRRGIEWLKFKNLISIEESSIQRVFAASEGMEAVKKGLPERRLVNSLKEGKVTISEVLASGAIKNEEINAAIAGARRNQWIQLVEGKMVPTPLVVKKSPEETFIENLKTSEAAAGGGGGVQISKLTEEEKRVLELLKKRPNYIEIKEEKESRISLTEAAKHILPTLTQEKKLERRILTTELITSGKWKETNFSALDVQAPAPVIYPGRRHPLIEIIEEIKEVFIGLGFSEIEGPVIQSSFWNFDALFTPQDHPSREMQDTFYISSAQMQQPLPIPASKDQISKISRIHKERWNRPWDVQEAQPLVLRTHTTPVTVQHLAKLKSSDVGRFFSVGRVFRNEKVSYKHLVEFHQVEGVSTSEEASLRDLMGLQKEFYAKMGLKRIKFWPTFFPYTEPSLQSMVYNEKLEKWVELFGMGIFRPEVTKPLGIKNPVLAWGGGLERIAMLRFGLDDVRELYGNKLAWLRSVPKCQL
jgi:phenylalanyl-tRNA synthetase alpha chain